MHRVLDPACRVGSVRLPTRLAQLCYLPSTCLHSGAGAYVLASKAGFQRADLRHLRLEGHHVGARGGLEQQNLLLLRAGC